MFDISGEHIYSEIIFIKRFNITLYVLKDEITILSSIESDKLGKNENRMQNTASAVVKEPPKKPFIITRDALQAQVNIAH